MADEKDHVRGIGSIANSLLGLVEERQRQGGIDIAGIPTGFWKVDDWTDGLLPDNGWLVGATTGGGKTAWMLDVAVSAATHGVLYYSLEMSGESLTYRLLSKLTGVAPIRIKRGKLTETELREVQAATQKLNDLKIAIVDKTFTSVELMEHAKRQRDRFEFGVVMVDYVQILRDENVHGSTARVATISNNLRSLARPDQLNMPVMMAGQLNRASQHREDDTPTIHDFKDSSQLEQDAEIVILLHRPHLKRMRSEGAEPQEVEKAKIIVAKTRNGAVGETWGDFHPKTMSWSQRKPDPVVPQAVQTKPAAGKQESLVGKAKRGRK